MRYLTKAYFRPYDARFIHRKRSFGYAFLRRKHGIVDAGAARRIDKRECAPVYRSPYGLLGLRRGRT